MGLKKAADISVNLLIALFLSFSFVYALTSSLNFTYSPYKIIFIILALLAVFFVLLYNSLSIKITLVVFGIGLIVAAAYLAYAEKLSGVINGAWGLVNWIIDYINRVEILNENYQFYTILVLCFFFTLFAYIFIIKKFYFYLVLAAGLIIFILQWTMNYLVNYLPFYLFMLIILICYFKYIYMKKSSKLSGGSDNSAVFILLAAPVCGIVLLFAAALPASSKPIEWKWLDKKINHAYSYINNRFIYQNFEYFSLKSTGFSQEDGLLGGGVRLDNTLVLKVDTPRKVYLKGAAKDYYTGSAWINSEKTLIPLEALNYSGDSKIFYLDTLELVYGIRLLEGDGILKYMDNRVLRNPLEGKDLEKFFYRDQIKITYENLKTKSMFIPIKPFKITPGKENTLKPFFNAEGILSANKALGKGYSYAIDAYSIKPGDEGLIENLRKSRKGMYNEFLEHPEMSIRITAQQDDSVTVVRDRFVKPQERILSDIELLSENAGKIYARYLQLPDTLPERVKELANSIASLSSTDYDKVKDIEQYLSSNYPYNLKVKNTPTDRDFVDYFLFDLKQGYCTYYATAMTVLVRSLGIPARYVEGYILPPKAASGNTYHVTNEQAHAWVEVYFEGFGWMPFEPTSPFLSSFYGAPEAVGNISSSMVNDPYYLQYMSRIQQYGNTNISNIPGGMDVGLPDENQTLARLFIPAVSASVLVIVLIFILLFHLIRRKFIMYLFKRMPPRESVLSLVKHYIKILSMQGYRVRPGETPFEFSRRVSDYLLIDPVTVSDNYIQRPVNSVNTSWAARSKLSKFDYVMNIFTLARYSRADITEANKEFVLEYYNLFKERTKKNMGPFKYFIVKNFWGSI